MEEPVRRPRGGRWGVARMKSVKNDGNRTKSSETEGIVVCRARWSDRSSPPGPTCSSEPVESRLVGAGTPFRRSVVADEGEERRRGGRTGSATQWRLVGRRAAEIVEKRRKSNKIEGKRTKPKRSGAVRCGGALGPRRRDRPAPPSRSRVARSAQGHRSGRPLRRIKGRERGRGGRTVRRPRGGWWGCHAAGIGEKRRKSNEIERK